MEKGRQIEVRVSSYLRNAAMVSSIESNCRLLSIFSFVAVVVVVADDDGDIFPFPFLAPLRVPRSERYEDSDRSMHLAVTKIR